jgi:hypothetical protein
MAIRVTKPVTKFGRYYAAGDIVDDPTAVELSLARLFMWETVDDSKPLGGLRKPELVQLAEDDGLDVSGLTKAQIVELLEG